jgi:hypothetical protein
MDFCVKGEYSIENSINSTNNATNSARLSIYNLLWVWNAYNETFTLWKNVHGLN